MTDTCLIIQPLFQQRIAGRDRLYARPAESEIEEVKGLARAIALDVLDAHGVKIYKISAGYLLGEGARATLKAQIEEKNPTVVIVNFNLSPVQQRNLETEWKVKVIDRTGLILEIFGERAQTKEGRIQVDLAALNYQRSRLVKSWTHLERQRSGGGFLGGPGETQLELDRRLIDDRIIRLKKQLIEVRRTRELGRKNREKVPFPIVALVGYTNAGKSTLFNTLTGADVFAEDLPFATLDPTLRRLKLPNGEIVILSDTVGFIADLPTHLIEAFRATLEQVQYADAILHVRDFSSPDTQAQREDVIAVLRDLDIDYNGDDRVIEVLNKTDLTEEQPENSRRDFQGPIIGISALKGENLDKLFLAIQKIVSKNRVKAKINLASGNGKALAWLYENSAILEQRRRGETLYLMASLDPKDMERFAKAFPDIKIKQMLEPFA